MDSVIGIFHPFLHLFSSATIMISHLIYNYFASIMKDTPVLTDLQKRTNIKFLQPSARSGNGKKRVKTDAEEYDWNYHPVLASGRVLASGMLDPILFQSFKNGAILPFVKLLCGLKFEEDYQMEEELGVESSRFAHIPVPTQFEGRPYAELYSYFTAVGVVPLGIYRQSDNDGLFYWGNKLPYCYTSPAPPVLLREKDLIYVLRRE